MSKWITMFNNKGGVGKTTLTWNIAYSLSIKEKKNKILMIDFDPQCNLSIAFLGENKFKETLPNEHNHYGNGIRSYLQSVIRTNEKKIPVLQKNELTKNISLISGDFWLNIYSEQLNLGIDILSGHGLHKYVALRNMVDDIEKDNKVKFDYVFIDVPPSFGTLVRAAFYSSSYIIVPCTSDCFSSYCVSLLGLMLPKFISEWDKGLERLKEEDPYSTEYDNLGKPQFLGWIFNGFDTSKDKKIKADQYNFSYIKNAIKNELVDKLYESKNKYKYDLVSDYHKDNYCIGEIEDMNTLMQLSLKQSVPIALLKDSAALGTNQKKMVDALANEFNKTVNIIINS